MTQQSDFTMLVEDDGLKRCFRCRQSKARSAFRKDRTKRDGLRSYCEQCDIVYRNSVREQTNQDRRQYYWANRELCLERARRWKDANREAVNEWSREYRRQNIDVVADRYRQWAQSDLGKSTRRAISHKRRAIQKRLVHRPFPRNWHWQQLQIQKKRCHYCDRRFTEGLPPTIDHVIPIARGGDDAPENCVLACKPCNSSKKDKLWRLL